MKVKGLLLLLFILLIHYVASEFLKNCYWKNLGNPRFFDLSSFYNS